MNLIGLEKYLCEAKFYTNLITYFIIESHNEETE